MGTRQVRTDPFRTYILLRAASLAASALSGAVVLRVAVSTLGPWAETRLYLPAVTGLLTVLAVSLLALRLFAHRWVYAGTLRATLAPWWLSAASAAILRRSLPRTFLMLFFLLIVIPWSLSVRELAPWLEGLSLGALALLSAAANVFAWWNLGEDSEAASGSLLWPRRSRPLRFFPRRYDPTGRPGWEITTRLLELSDQEARWLLGSGPSPEATVHRRMVAHVLAEFTARLVGSTSLDEAGDLVRTPLSALDGASVLALARRAADTRDDLTVADLVVRVGGLTLRELPDDSNMSA